MTKTKSKIIGSVIIAVMLLVSSMLLLAGCGGDPYQMTYGTYEYYGVRISDADGNNDMSYEDARGEIIFFVRFNFTFNEDGTVEAYSLRDETTSTGTYTVNSNGYVTFNIDELNNDPVIPLVFENFGNHGYFEGNNFYFRYSCNDDLTSETFSICVLNEQAQVE